MTKLGYTQADMDVVCDNPEWTAEDFANAKSFDEMFPDMAAKLRRARGPQKAPRKASTTIRLSPEVLAFFKQSGPGWQSRIDGALKDWMAARS